MIKPLFTQQSFEDRVHIVREECELTLREAVCTVCAEHQIEPENIVPLISRSLRDKLEVEAMRDNILPKRASIY
jgi:hypothetical protein